MVVTVRVTVTTTAGMCVWADTTAGTWEVDFIQRRRGEFRMVTATLMISIPAAAAAHNGLWVLGWLEVGMHTILVQPTHMCTHVHT
jgi:hypothetical protein